MVSALHGRDFVISSLSPRKGVVLAALFLLVVSATSARAQYFGQNKVQYETFEFRVLKTEHFDIHYYPEEAQAAQDVARLAERWHSRLSRLLRHTLSGRQPLVIYASHPHFEQTNVIEGLIDEATGGVTEGARRRVVMPLAASLAETDHVLGHELVHAFQFDILGRAGGAIPLWFIEGMAEYLSLGPRHVQTSMWLRDSLIHEKLPRIQDLDNPRYFPYRFGHAFWAYIGGRWGDEAISSILSDIVGGSLVAVDETGTAGVVAGGRGSSDPISAIERVTGLDSDTLTKEWHESIRETYAALRINPPADVQPLIGERTGGGSLNVGPALSPDGTRIAFLSSRDQLSINLFLADATTGRVLRTLVETAGDPHFDSLQFLQSAGAWNPAGTQIALGTVRRGRPVLAIIDADDGDVSREIRFEDLGEIFHPSWSPDGQQIVFAAQVNGYSDLFSYDLSSNQRRRLTSDQFTDLQPAWSPDGSRIVFVTDRHRGSLQQLLFSGYGLSSVDVRSGAVSEVQTGLTGSAINPQWASNGALYFLADDGGRQNAYRLDAASTQATKLTDEPNGISGITGLSPALSVAAAAGNLAAMSVFRDGGYEIHLIRPDQVPASTSTQPPGVDAALLPPTPRKTSEVASILEEPAGTPTVEEEPYDPDFTLLQAGQQIGVTGISSFGTFVSGGISLLFGDTLGNHLLGTTFQIEGSAADIAADVVYLNRTRRWNWGLFGGRVPYRSGTARQTLGSSGGRTVLIDQVDIFRETHNQVGALVAYPTSRSTRLEFATSARHIGFTVERFTQVFDLASGQLVDEARDTTTTAPSLTIGDVSAAFVRDTSAFGATSPLRGERMRVEVAPWFGDLTLTNFTFDYRRYVMPVRPVTLAGRALHIGRYGSGGEDGRLFPLFLGYPELVRGYDAGTFEAVECTPSEVSSCPEFDNLFGSRLLIFNGEVRAPLVGLFTGNLSYGPVPVEVFGFADTGVAWTQTDNPSFAGGERKWSTSVGAGARVNLFGFAIAEFNLARPLQRPEKGWMFVFNFRPGF